MAPDLRVSGEDHREQAPFESGLECGGDAAQQLEQLRLTKLVRGFPEALRMRSGPPPAHRAGILRFLVFRHSADLADTLGQLDSADFGETPGRALV